MKYKLSGTLTQKIYMKFVMKNIFFASIVVFVILEIYAIYSQSIVGLVFGIAAPLIFLLGLLLVVSEII
ncbi:hypothetical protein llh_10490 [Lactococcus cremoris subsp. cremoris A76]|uniref:hypothetical protein n=1 Tax=Lactococcus lactis subsp. cremoris TaxID=1359 RepID=UPI000238D123|nr:hypothetical protein [Lactococcus cremoris]AEU41274.1 hypothetical protein llh_10490 [Lactococcus cremoris subsp. cremoris A76]